MFFRYFLNCIGPLYMAIKFLVYESTYYMYIYIYNTDRYGEGKSDSHNQHFSHKPCLLSAMFCISKSRGFSPVNHFTLVFVQVAWTSTRKIDVTHRGNSARVDGIPWNMLITSCQLWPRLTSLFCWSEQPWSTYRINIKWNWKTWTN